jgi:HK97 family phage major capsid protein
MTPEELQALRAALKSKLDAFEAIVPAEGSKGLTKEQLAQKKAIMADMESLRDQIDLADKENTMKAWGNQSAGSAVAGGFGRVALPGEGNIPGISQRSDPAMKDYGELYALDGVGEQKLNALKSGLYKDAMNAYMRAKNSNDLYDRIQVVRQSAKHVEILAAFKGDAMKVMNEGSDTAGGFWVPPDIRSELIKKIATLTAIRPNASAYTTGSDRMVFPKVTYTADDKYTTGARLTWTGSEAQTTDLAEATNPVAGQVQIPVNLARLGIILQREQVEDNQFDILGYVSDVGAETYALGEDDYFLNGVGVGEPQGMLNHPTFGIASGSTSTVAGSTYSGGYVISGDSDNFTWEGSSFDEPTKGILGLEGALPPQYENNAKWYANKRSYTAIRGLLDSQHRPLWQQTDAGWGANFVRGLPATLLGYGVEKDQFMPDYATNALAMLFGDMKGYFIADRIGLSVEVFRETLAAKDQVLVYMRKRVGGQLVHYWRLKALKIAAS